MKNILLTTSIHTCIHSCSNVYIWQRAVDATYIMCCRVDFIYAGIKQRARRIELMRRKYANKILCTQHKQNTCIQRTVREINIIQSSIVHYRAMYVVFCKWIEKSEMFLICHNSQFACAPRGFSFIVVNFWMAKYILPILN